MSTNDLVSFSATSMGTTTTCALGLISFTVPTLWSLLELLTSGCETMDMRTEIYQLNLKSKGVNHVGI